MITVNKNCVTVQISSEIIGAIAYERNCCRAKVKAKPQLVPGSAKHCGAESIFTKGEVPDAALWRPFLPEVNKRLC